MREKVIAFIKPCASEVPEMKKHNGKIKILRRVQDNRDPHPYILLDGTRKKPYRKSDGVGWYYGAYNEIVIITKENRHLFSKKGVK